MVLVSGLGDVAGFAHSNERLDVFGWRGVEGAPGASVLDLYLGDGAEYVLDICVSRRPRQAVG